MRQICSWILRSRILTCYTTSHAKRDPLDHGWTSRRKEGKRQLYSKLLQGHISFLLVRGSTLGHRRTKVSSTVAVCFLAFYSQVTGQVWGRLSLCRAKHGLKSKDVDSQEKLDAKRPKLGPPTNLKDLPVREEEQPQVSSIFLAMSRKRAFALMCLTSILCTSR